MRTQPSHHFPPSARNPLAALKIATFLIAACLLPLALEAQTIDYSAEKKLWMLHAGESSYAMGVNERGELQSLYWGPKIAGAGDFSPAHSSPEWASFEGPPSTTLLEYAGWGAALTLEPALKATFADGNRDLVLHYQDHHVSGDTLEITLRDVLLPVYVRLYYKVYAAQGMIERSAKIENQTQADLTIEQAASATFSLPEARDYRRHWLTGRWAGEWQLNQQSIEPGLSIMESRNGSTSHRANPWFAIDRAGETTEENGPVYFGELGWSGSWRIVVEHTPLHQIRITGGYNPFDFAYRLAPGESLATPPFYVGFTSQGMGAASRMLHRFQQEVIVPGAPHPRLRPVLYNSWEATGFEVNETGQMSLAEKAAAMGAERFVMDDGWFGRRSDDHAGLGDWYVNPKKFPHGLKPLIDRVRSLGMDFGIWVEPEMVNPDSDLYRKHPEWAMNFPGRPRTQARNQLVLNLARPDVKEYLFTWLDALVSENDVAFLKWDYNRVWGEPGWDALPVQDQKKIYVAYVNNLYELLDRLRKKHPKLEIESCSGGGGRVDLGILRRTDEVWTSDNTDALDRLTLQSGFTRAYSPGLMMAWVTDSPNFLDYRSTSLKFRFLVAMQGSLGIGGNLNKWTPQELALAANTVQYYKKVRTMVQQGLLYRLIEPSTASSISNQSASEYVSPDRRHAVVFAYLNAQQFQSPFPVVRLRGLDPKSKYRVHSLSDDQYSGPGTASGDYLMNYGVRLNLKGDYDSASVELEQIP